MSRYKVNKSIRDINAKIKAGKVVVATAEEIIADCPEVDAFVAGLGTGGTLMGVGRRLRRHNPGVRIFASEPLPGESVQGLRSLDEGFIPEIFDPTIIDGKILVSNVDAIEALRELTEKEGIFAGVSCGAVMVAAKQLARYRLQRKAGEIVGRRSQRIDSVEHDPSRD